MLPSPPSSPKMADIEKDVKKTVSPRTGRQRTGAYSREEVNVIQTWITNRISEDWATIALEVCKATGSYRQKDNLKTFYGTVVLRQVREAFADKNGEGGSITAADVCEGSNTEKICGACGAKQIEATKERERTVRGEATQHREEAKQEGKAPQEREEEKQEERAEMANERQEHSSPSIGEE